MRALLYIYVLLLGVSACGSNDNEESTTSRTQDEQYLENLLSEIKHMSSQITCSDAKDWAFVPLGSKACGGPMEYIAYSKNIDVALFLKKVDEYTKKQDEFNKKWGIVSDCSFVTPPTKIVCKDGKPILER